jgi:hypothetical protein
MQQALAVACPPDLKGVAERTAAAWEKPLHEEARSTAEVLLNTIEPYQREIEQHFALEGQRRFRGLMAGYLQLFTRVRYAGTSLRDRIPFLPRARDAAPAPATWNLATISRACSEVAANRHLDARSKALANRLLVGADEQGFPLDLLTEPVEAVSRLDWRQRHAQTLIEVLQQVEQQWSRPTGVRRVLHGVILFLADWLPPLALLAACIRVLWLYFMTDKVQLVDALLPVVVLVVVLVILHICIALLLPLRWPAIRGEFQRQLERRLQAEMESAYQPVPGEVAEVLRGERRQAEQLMGETREVAAWLERREQAASIAGLYGK